MKKIAILLTCYNRKEKTINCLESFYKAIEVTDCEIKSDIFLVDDGSDDGTSDEVTAKFPTIKIIQGNGNLYWNRGMNLAWETAAKYDYDFYLWLNDDTTLFPNSIKSILNDSKLKNNKSIIAGACRSKDGRVTYSGYNNLKEKKKLKPIGTPLLCDYFNGNVVLIPSIVFKQVGFLDPLFHHGQGDFDYGLRAKILRINSFVSSTFVCVCELHNDLPVWCNPKYNLSVRWKNFKSPLGGNPKSTFIFQRAYLGLLPAAFHYFTIHLRLIYPNLWKR